MGTFPAAGGASASPLLCESSGVLCAGDVIAVPPLPLLPLLRLPAVAPCVVLSPFAKLPAARVLGTGALRPSRCSRASTSISMWRMHSMSASALAAPVWRSTGHTSACGTAATARRRPCCSDAPARIQGGVWNWSRVWHWAAALQHSHHPSLHNVMLQQQKFSRRTVRGRSALGAMRKKLPALKYETPRSSSSLPRLDRCLTVACAPGC